MRYKVTARFYLLLLLAALLVVYLFRDAIFGRSEITVIYSGTANDVRSVQGLVVRDETLVNESGVARVDFISPERTIVKQGEVCAYVYTQEYSLTRIANLNSARKDIQAYHKLVLGNELDSELDSLDLKVNQMSIELRNVVSGSTHGNILTAVANLQKAMVARREYMSANMRSDSKLIKYYDVEKQNQNAIASWQVPKAAPVDGVVSFYLDGYEQTLNADTVSDLTISDVYTVLSGGKLAGSDVKGVSNVFRVVNQNHWYMVLITNDPTWNPMQDDHYSFIVEGFDDIVCEGVIIQVSKFGNDVMAVVEMNEPIGSMFYTRACNVTIGANLSGYSVNGKAIATVSGQTGVWLYDVPGGTFVPVEVLYTYSDGSVLFKPLVDSVMSPGTQLLIK